ncbi:MAG: SMP-30/gluconolactonase/LRE family protein [Chloroflexota bacterium]
MPAQLTDLVESERPSLVSTGFEFTEGPLWHPEGFLYVSDVDARVHYRVDLPGGERTALRADSGGANGATFDSDGNVVMCEQDARRVVRLADDGLSATEVATHYEGKRLNRCNDIVPHSDGSLYFTDPDRFLPEEEKEIGSSAVFRLEPSGELRLLASDMNHPNGIAFSPDERVLYVSNTRPDPHLHAYDVADDGSLTNSRVFGEMPYIPSPEGTFTAHDGGQRPLPEKGGVPDGLKVDVEGHIYCTGPGGTWVWGPDGTLVGVIHTPELPANVGWGGADRRTLYLCCRTSVYSLRMRVPGAAIPGVPSEGSPGQGRLL